MQFVVEPYQFGGGYDQAPITRASADVAAIYAGGLSGYDPILVVPTKNQSAVLAERLASHGRAMMRFYLMLLALVIGLGAVPLLEVRLAHAHDPQRPDLEAWFQSLKSKSGNPCCDGSDPEHAEAEWDFAKAGYKVFLKNPKRPNEAGQWFDVPDSVVVERPNLNGIAMVWWHPSYDIDGKMTPQVALLHSGSRGVISLSCWSRCLCHPNPVSRVSAMLSCIKPLRRLSA
jgi:hypothetical protein